MSWISAKTPKIFCRSFFSFDSIARVEHGSGRMVGMREILLSAMLICLSGCYSCERVELQVGKKMPNRVKEAKTLYYAGSDRNYHNFYYFYMWWIDCWEWQPARLPRSDMDLEFEFALECPLPKTTTSLSPFDYPNIRGTPVRIILDEKNKLKKVEPIPRSTDAANKWGDKEPFYKLPFHNPLEIREPTSVQ
jgi:hypothetical protein